MSRTVQVRAAAVAARREYCRCTTVQNYGYAEAAKKLGCEERWLRDRSSSLPHQQIGQNRVFCDCELAIIQAICSVMPEPAKTALCLVESPPENTETPAATLRSIRPAQGRRRRT